MILPGKPKSTHPDQLRAWHQSVADILAFEASKYEMEAVAKLGAIPSCPGAFDIQMRGKFAKRTARDLRERVRFHLIAAIHYTDYTPETDRRGHTFYQRLAALAATAEAPLTPAMVNHIASTSNKLAAA